MNTRKQVLIMSVLLMLTLIIVGIYGAWYPSRESDAEEEFAERTSERAAILFARNCRLCHGDVGEGGSLGGRLAAAPALDRAALQGFADSKAPLAADAGDADTEIKVTDAKKFEAGDVILVEEERLEVTRVDADANVLQVARGVEHTEAGFHAKDAAILLFDLQLLTAPSGKIKLITNTITCGRVGTAMQVWGQTQGGTLSDEQIRQLTVLITKGRWDLVKEEVDVEDRVSAELLQAVTEDEEGNPLKDKSGFLRVERGVLRTAPQEHAVDTVIFRFPQPAAPTLLQSSCGQTAPPAAAPGLP